MHEWVKDPENYTCTCGENGNGKLYLNAVRNYLKTYYELKDDYNIIFTGYYWCQGEHEKSSYGSNVNNTIHDIESYYNAYKSMHTSLMADCKFDFGSIFMPRSAYQYHPDFRATDKPSGSTNKMEQPLTKMATSPQAARRLISQTVTTTSCTSQLSLSSPITHTISLIAIQK